MTGIIKLTLCYTPKKWTISTGAAAGRTRVLRSAPEEWTRRMLLSKALCPMMTIEGRLILVYYGDFLSEPDERFCSYLNFVNF